MRMEAAGSSGSGGERPISGGSSPLFRRALLLAVSSLSAVVVLLAVNAYSPNVFGFLAIQFLSVVFILSSSAAAVAGVIGLWRGRPDLRDPILFLLVACLSIFFLHVHTINLPPTNTPGNVMGFTGTTFRNNDVAVTSSISASHLSLTVDDTGSSAISKLVATFANSTLPA